MSFFELIAQGDAVSRLVALLLVGMSVASWVVILWKVWLLPAGDTGKDFQWPPGFAFRVQTGPKPAPGRKVELHLEFDPASTGHEKLKVYANSRLLTPLATAQAPVLAYGLPTDAMEDEAQVIEIVGAEPAKCSIVRVEIVVS